MQELEAISLSISIAKEYNIFSLRIISDNQGAITLALMILTTEGPIDFLDLADNKKEVADLLQDISTFRGCEIDIQHVRSHTGGTSDRHKLNACADQLANQLLDAVYEQPDEDDYQVAYKA